MRFETSPGSAGHRTFGGGSPSTGRGARRGPNRLTYESPRRVGLWKGLPTRGAHSYVGKAERIWGGVSL